MHPGVVLLARRSGAVVIPVWVDGPPAMRSPLLAYLKPSRSRVTFGPPVELGEGMGRDEAMAEIKRRLLELKAGGS
jgi:1-acyl-sn-glycerol-3-phosphate acyltransferase